MMTSSVECGNIFVGILFRKGHFIRVAGSMIFGFDSVDSFYRVDYVRISLPPNTIRKAPCSAVRGRSV